MLQWRFDIQHLAQLVYRLIWSQSKYIELTTRDPNVKITNMLTPVITSIIWYLRDDYDFDHLIAHLPLPSFFMRPAFFSLARLPLIVPLGIFMAFVRVSVLMAIPLLPFSASYTSSMAGFL